MARWATWTSRGEVVIPIQYDNGESFQRGYAQVVQGVDTFYINKLGERIIEKF
jgi:hypothetical protein